MAGMAGMAAAAPVQNEKPGASSWSPIWVLGPKELSRPARLPQVQRAQLEVEQPGLEPVLMWAAGTLEGSFPAMPQCHHWSYFLKNDLCDGMQVDPLLAVSGGLSPCCCTSDLAPCL